MTSIGKVRECIGTDQRDRMACQPIENYAIIGDMLAVVLVGMNGSLDWFCFPHAVLIKTLTEVKGPIKVFCEVAPLS